MALSYVTVLRKKRSIGKVVKILICVYVFMLNFLYAFIAIPVLLKKGVRSKGCHTHTVVFVVCRVVECTYVND